MNKKLIGLISVFIVAEIVCIIGYNVQSALRYSSSVYCRMNDPWCTPEWITAYNNAENDKVFVWVYAFFNIAYIFVILLTILLMFSYYQKKKRNHSLPFETQGILSTSKTQNEIKGAKTVNEKKKLRIILYSI